MFYPLEVAERAGSVWGAADEAAYRRLLAPLVPENMLAAMAARGVKTDRRERIYNVAYSYREDEGAAYRALTQPTPVAAFALPRANRFMPSHTRLLAGSVDAGLAGSAAASAAGVAARPALAAERAQALPAERTQALPAERTQALSAERAQALIDEPGLVLHYAPDREFLRPQTAVVLRFVPLRELASADNDALLALWGRALQEALDTDIEAARAAGVRLQFEPSLEGLRITVTGYGDSPARVLRHFGSRLRDFVLTPQRFAAVKEQAQRAITSYVQTEARRWRCWASF